MQSATRWRECSTTPRVGTLVMGCVAWRDDLGDRPHRNTRTGDRCKRPRRDSRRSSVSTRQLDLRPHRHAHRTHSVTVTIDRRTTDKSTYRRLSGWSSRSRTSTRRRRCTACRVRRCRTRCAVSDTVSRVAACRTRFSLMSDARRCWRVESCTFGTTSGTCLLYTSPSPRDRTRSRMPSSA